MSMIKRCNNCRAVPYQTAKGKTHQNSGGQNAPVVAVAVDFRVNLRARKSPCPILLDAVILLPLVFCIPDT